MSDIKSEIRGIVRKHLLTQHQGIAPSVRGAQVSGKVFDENEILNVIDAAMAGWWTDGDYCAELSKKICAYLSIRHCILVNSGSSANFLAIKALTSPSLGERRIQPGDEIVTAAAGFPTTITPIIDAGATPVFVDVEIESLNPQYNAVINAVTPKTRAIILAHTLGNPFDAKRLRQFCDENGIWLIEDNCDAFGSRLDNQYTGTFGHLATLSFYPAHHITTAEGGAVLTNDDDLKRIVVSMRDWGRDCWCGTGEDNCCGNRFGWKKGTLPKGYDHKFTFSELGYNLKMTDLQAAIGVAQMDKLADFTARRKENFEYLKKQMSHLKDYFIFPASLPNAKPSWFGMPLTMRQETADRELLLRHLNSEQIGTRLLFAGNITRQPCFIDNNVQYRISGTLDNTDKLMRHTFWVGVYPGLNNSALNYLCDTISKYFHGSADNAKVI